MSEPILADKVRAIEASGAEVVATGNPGCAMQIAKGLAGTAVEVMHPIEILDRSYA
jgi:glycolate oxidase iron-sulfur subunit